MLTLDALLTSVMPSLSGLIERKAIRLVRHATENRTDGDWKGFDDKLRFDPDLLRIFTGDQAPNKFKNVELILVFVTEDSTRCMLRGAFWCKGAVSHQRFQQLYPRHVEYRKFREERKAPRQSPTMRNFYELDECQELAGFNNRLVIDWGKSQNSFQSKVDKAVWQILPKGFVTQFPGWQNVLISHSRLKAIIANRDGNLDWYQFFSEHDCVYVILDSKSGKLYVGAAYADGEKTSGLWGRWRGYARTGDNGNVGLVELTDLDINHSDYFKYSIHHVFPKGTKTKEEIVQIESDLKQKLGARGLNGLNRN
jgi:hypothetical protein